MLVIGRRQSQKIRITDEIVVTIVEIRGRQVSIGIEAPDEVQILRPEALNKYPKRRRGKSQDEGRQPDKKQ